MKIYSKLILTCLFLLVSIIKVESQNFNIDKKVDSIIRLGLKQNLFFSSVKENYALDKKGLIVDFPCENWTLKIKCVKKIDSLLPDFYGLVVQIAPYIYCNDSLHSSVSDKIFDSIFSSKVLIAVKENNCEFIVASTSVNPGTLMKSKYAHIFNLTKGTNNYSEFISYLKLHMYFFNLKNIKYKKKNRKWIYFSAFEIIKGVERKIYLKVNRNNINEVIYLGWKISGKYKDKELIGIY